ncbi:Protein FAM173B [Seminavis robusta]|uniref:Protein FAM173B n=1 Tax=Seminavis robusta TaxID=568900 RepID=A0A9N8EVC0_9STRA|nr:Protein FAM173B [Seminavis robusta]|eukprot:Sro1672_g290190.1 Protein FAM173B (168) ;mRNA; f:23382-23885
MFQQLQQQLAVSRLHKSKSLTFVDLGSGDGRLVFRAARQGIFSTSIGYEINPILHAVGQSRRLLQAPKYWHSTQFYWRDIWKVDLQQADVVAVYGLGPIMEPLGVKLRDELKPGSIVVSNVFSIPGWKPEGTSRHGTYVYVVPDELNEHNKNNHKKDEEAHTSNHGS